MTYTIKRKTIGRRRVPCFSIVNERNQVFANESTEALAKAHIPRLEAADKRRADNLKREQEKDA